MQNYSKIINTVSEYIEKIDLSEDIDIKEPLKSKLFEILKAPSKRIRPLISFLYLKALGIEIDKKQIVFQSAIELVHNASLIHDDVIDKSVIRRNTKTINEVFDNNLAVISGDYLLAIAMKKVLSLNVLGLCELFCDTLKIMVKGEVNQYFDKNKIPSINDYIIKSEQKTAKLFQTAISGALMIASFEYKSEFGKNFGIAFQIRDDLINCKTSKSDINEGIYTAPVIFSGGTKISDDGIEKTKILLNNYLNAAQKSLDNLEDSKYKGALIDLIGMLRDE